MLPAPSLSELNETLRKKRTPLIGILFAPPYTRIASERIIPRLGYLDVRTGQHIHFFCAGYGGYGFADDAQSIGDGRYEHGTVIPWGFSQRKFAEFVSELEKVTTWAYSGEADLILVSPELEFSDAIVYDLDAMLTDGAIDNPARLFESIITFARSRADKTATHSLSDKTGMRALGDVAADAIIEQLPKPLQKLWKRGLHFRVRNLTRS